MGDQRSARTNRGAANGGSASTAPFGQGLRAGRRAPYDAIALTRLSVRRIAIGGAGDAARRRGMSKTPFLAVAATTTASALISHLVTRALIRRRTSAGWTGHLIATRGHKRPEPPVAYALAALRALPEIGRDVVLPMAPIDTQRHQGHLGLLVSAETDMEVRDHPHGFAFARLTPRYAGSPLWLPVIDQQAGWAQVLLPGRTIGASGWLDANRVSISRSDHEIRINLRTTRLNLMHRGSVTRTWQVDTTGTAGTLSLGRTFILSIGRDCSQRGLPVLRLAADATNLDGTVATSIGTATARGCLTVPAGALPPLARVPLGTLVRIHA